MALNECIECIATLIDSNFIYRAFYYKREKEIQLTVCAKEVSSREEKSVDIFGFFASEKKTERRPEGCVVFLVVEGLLNIVVNW